MKTYTIADEQRALLPDEQDVAFYEEHGWYISKKVIPDDVIAEAIAGSEGTSAGSANDAAGERRL